jgi:hypothetical protein
MPFFIKSYKKFHNCLSIFSWLILKEYICPVPFDISIKYTVYTVKQWICIKFDKNLVEQLFVDFSWSLGNFFTKTSGHPVSVFRLLLRTVEGFLKMFHLKKCTFCFICTYVPTSVAFTVRDISMLGSQSDLRFLWRHSNEMDQSGAATTSTFDSGSRTGL